MESCLISSLFNT